MLRGKKKNLQSWPTKLRQSYMSFFVTVVLCLYVVNFLFVYFIVLCSSVTSPSNERWKNGQKSHLKSSYLSAMAISGTQKKSFESVNSSMLQYLDSSQSVTSLPFNHSL